MYNAKFISNDGGIFVFGADGSNVFDIDGLSGMAMITLSEKISDSFLIAISADSKGSWATRRIP